MGYGMQFEQVASLAGKTMTGALCTAWETDPADVIDCERGKRPMTLREAGALAELHGLELAEVLAF